jgi:hypothetical protein
LIAPITSFQQAPASTNGHLPDFQEEVSGMLDQWGFDPDYNRS